MSPAPDHADPSTSPRAAWQAAFDAAPQRDVVAETLSGIPLDAVHGDAPFPGQFPYTRGIHPGMYRSRLWTMRMFAGFGTADDTNARFRALLAAGGTGLSTAFDMPTLMGRDSDDAWAEGEVGRAGVAVDTLVDMRDLFAGIDLGAVTTSMTINGPAAVLMAMYVATAEAAVNRMRSVTSRTDGRGGKMYSFCAWYSFRMSFCSVPPSRERCVPAFSAWATNMAKIGAAGELIVIDVVTAPRSMSANRSSMSARLSMATPQRPTSPSAIGSSESMPSSVGMSNAVDSPSPPALMISLNRQFVSSAVPKPANIRIVQSFERYIDAYGPRVYGYSPGNSPASGP